MEKNVKYILYAIFLILAILIILVGSLVKQTFNEKISSEIFPQKFHVEGNKIVDESGKEVVLRGLTPIDPVTLAYNNKNNRFIPFTEEIFKRMSEWDAQIIRLPISPSNWRKYGKEEVFKAIDKSIEWSAKYGMYVYIDFHGIGFPPTEEYKDEWSKTTKKEILEFWDETSKYYKDNNLVVFYELFNEPAFSGKYPPTEESLETDWIEWKEFVEKVIDVIRKNDPDSVIIVGGLVWAHDISFAEKNPIERENIVYAVHPYPGTLDYPKTWDETFGKIQKKYPVYVTEFGHSLKAFLKQKEVREKVRVYVPSIDSYLQKAEENFENKENIQELWDQMEADIYNDEQASRYIEQLEKDYETKIKSYLDDRNIGWTAWSFSQAYNTQLLKDKNYTPTKSGEFFKQWLTEKKGQNEPE